MDLAINGDVHSGISDEQNEDAMEQAFDATLENYHLETEVARNPLIHRSSAVVSS